MVKMTLKGGYNNLKKTGHPLSSSGWHSHTRWVEIFDQDHDQMIPKRDVIGGIGMEVVFILAGKYMWELLSDGSTMMRLSPLD